MPVDSVVEQVERGLPDGFVPLVMFSNPDIYQTELRRIFGKSWIFLGHESEIPSPGDYVVRRIGLDPFILARDESGKIHVFFNSCRHRGSLICRSDKGNTSHFRCPYHGWTYNNDGRLVGIPQKTTAYRDLDVDQWGLHEAPKADTYHGLVFASLDPKALSLIEYLGDFRWYLDLHLKFTGGLEVIGDPFRWVTNINWKTAVENFGGDSYHTQIVHKSCIDVGLVRSTVAGQAGRSGSYHVTECDGHGTSIRTDPGSHFWGYPKEISDRFDPESVSKEQYQLAKESVLHTGFVFPNLTFLHAAHTDAPEKPHVPCFCIHQWIPMGPDSTEVCLWLLVPKGSSQEYRQRVSKAMGSMVGVSGNMTADDIAVFEGITRASKSVFAEKFKLTLNYQMGLNSTNPAKILKSWPGPGVVYDTNLEEGVQRTFWRHWIESMKSE
ncbi:MAG: Rieske 2Fe-2S domain-containing protein [Thaumarchaeota archaeon]|nr:Rieske 2Fe-2S domain-containing protein [Nitrososphaerota archaeon]